MPFEHSLAIPLVFCSVAQKEYKATEIKFGDNICRCCYHSLSNVANYVIMIYKNVNLNISLVSDYEILCNGLLCN